MTIIWILSAMLAILAVVFFMGKGTFLIAGYNTASQEEKAKYDEKKLGKVMGTGMIAIAFILVICGILNFQFPVWIMPVAIIAVTVIMVILSNTICKNKEKAVNQEVNTQTKKSNKTTVLITVVSILMLVIIMCVSLFTGSINISVDKNDINISSSVWPEKKIAYDEIKSIEYTDNFNVGTRTNGYGSFKLQMGNFKNKKLGNYYLYSYTDCKEYIIIETKSGNIVLNEINNEKTKQLYKSIIERV